MAVVEEVRGAECSKVGGQSSSRAGNSKVTLTRSKQLHYSDELMLAARQTSTTSTMPSIIARQPAWLDRSSPAFNFFQTDNSRQDEDEHNRDAPSRKIAHRGSEIFAVVGNELRWSDLDMLRDASKSGSERQQPVYKV